MTTRNGNKFESGTGRIVGVVTAVPAVARTNDDWPDAQDAAKVTGVVERRQAREDQTTEALCISAARELLEALKWDPQTVAALVYVTQTPGAPMPAPAYAIHECLGLASDCDVYQVNESCAGYVKGLKLAQKLTSTTQHRVLLLVGDTTSRICNPLDRATAPLFGDAGSATAVEHDAASSDFFITGADGENNYRLGQAAGEFMQMDGGAVFSFTLKRVPALMADAQALTPTPDWILMHQANAFMLEHLAKKMRLGEAFDAGQIPTNVDRFGNCSSASIPLLLCDKLGVSRTAAAGKTRALLMGFGAGWSWGAASVNLSGLRVAHVVEVD